MILVRIFNLKRSITHFLELDHVPMLLVVPKVICMDMDSTPTLKQLKDTVLRKWYFHHYGDANDMPFGDDIADPFISPYIKFHKPSKEEEEVLRLRKQ